ncbi:MAG: metallophosphoesterase [Clostridia bacterium]|nr:metallophosphoesterase [Clostridia bacterium]
MSFNEIKQWVIGAVFGVVMVLTVVLPAQLVLIMGGTVTDEFPQTPSDFVPTVRLVAFTDTHNRNDNVALAVDTAYELFDNDETYAGVDAFFGLGDFSSVGGEGDYERYAQTLNEHVREETILVNIHGNHEFKDDNYKEYFAKYFDHEPDTVTDVNGFSCIAFSGTRSMTEWTFTSSSLNWLDKSISEAQAKADGKAVFVFQHPHAWGTVYGSTYWGDPQLNVIFNKHPGIVDFSGHSHYPMNDPRSILQTSYTTVGCGAMATFETDKNLLPGHHPDGYDKAAQICVIEADNDGSVRIRAYDLLSGSYINDYYIDNVNDSKTYAYTYKNLKAHDEAPVFAEGTSATAYKNEGGEWVISFDEAKAADGYIVHNYDITIKDENGKKVFSDKFVDDYFVIDDDDTADFRIGTDTLESGKTYTLSVKAQSAYKKNSKTINLEFTAQ